MKDVFKAVNDIVNSTVKFYLSYMSKVYSPQQYIRDEGTASECYYTDGAFLFDSIIANHITYIEKIRQLIIKQNIGFEFKNNNGDFLSNKTHKIPNVILVDINARFVYWIEQYIKLFECAYNYIKDGTGEIDSHSEATLNMFSQFKNSINDIKESNYNDFSTKIER